MSVSGEQLPGESGGSARTRPGRLSLLLASILLVSTAVLACCLGWAVALQRSLAGADAERRSQAAAQSIAAFAAPLVAKGDLSTLQAGIRDAAQRLGLSACVVQLSDGRVLADMDRTVPPSTTIPETWSAVGSGDLSLPSGPGTAAANVEIPDRGRLAVAVRLGLNDALRTGSAAWVGLGAIGVVGLGLVLMLCRGAARSARPLGAIRSALHAAASGDLCSRALAVDPRAGPDARAWNSILADRETLREQILAERADQAAGAGHKSDGTIQRACDSMPHGVLVLDAGGTVRYANGAAGVFLMHRREELIGKQAESVFTDDASLNILRSVIGEGRKRRASFEMERKTEDNTSVLRCGVVRLSHDESDSVLVMIEDVTQQRIADRSRDAFVAQATHELRTPLTNIRLYVETLQEEGESDAAVRGRCLNVISQETTRLERMVGDMLSVAEIEAGSLKLHSDDVRLDQLFPQLEADFAAQAAEKQISLTFDLPPKLPVIQGDRDKITLSLHNLIGNALKYTPTGGSVVVRAEESDEVLSVQVSDNGIGIPPEDRERIFEKFYRCGDERIAKIPGTGLGLALAREVIRLHGGDISVQSEPNRGSTFTISLPVTAKAA